MTHIPHRIPDTMSPHEVGRYMGGLREHYNLTLQDVTDRVHIRTRYLHAIETGEFDQLPSIVYARGYVHSYAEFLGLDPEQVVHLCFGNDTREEKPFPARPVAARSTASLARLRSGTAAALVIAIIALVAVQLRAHRSVEKVEVPPVPDTMLEALRTMAMPTPGNAPCFNDDGWMACFVTSAEWRMITAMGYAPTRYAANVDYMPPAVVDAPTVPAKPAETPLAAPAGASPKAESVKPVAAPVAVAEEPKKADAPVVDEPKKPDAEKPKHAVPKKKPAHHKTDGEVRHFGVDHNVIPELQR